MTAHHVVQARSSPAPQPSVVCNLLPSHHPFQCGEMVFPFKLEFAVSGPWPDGPMGVRCGLLRAELESFVHGDRMTISWDPSKARDAKMGRLDPIADEVWDVRSQGPSPGLRVFSRFAEKDVLLALTCSPRSISVSWLDRLPLLGRDSRQWKDAIIECKRD